MMQNDCSSAVSGVPAGLVACRVGGRQLHISSIAENNLWLRMDSMQDLRGTLEVCFRRLNGEWSRVSIDRYTAGLARCDDCGALIRLSFSDQKYSAEFKRAMAFYAEYIQAFSEEDVQSFTAYPSEMDDAYSDAFDLSWLRLPADREICISLHDPSLYALYLNHSAEDFLRKYAAEKGVPPIVKAHRMYIGNGFCRQLFPDETTLAGLLARARQNHHAVTLVTPPDPRLPDALLQSWRDEILVNDWGLLYRLRKYPHIQAVFGVLLNKRRKDPRMQYKPDLDLKLLGESSIHSPEYRAFLSECGVNRWEFERCGYNSVAPEGKCSLHLPWYQTNTSVYCPTRAICERGDRGAQSDDDGCPQYCLSNGIRYPAHLRMIARWNSLFALDDRPLEDLSGFDRIVLNL